MGDPTSPEPGHGGVLGDGEVLQLHRRDALHEGNDLRQAPRQPRAPRGRRRA